MNEDKAIPWLPLHYGDVLGFDRSRLNIIIQAVGKRKIQNQINANFIAKITNKVKSLFTPSVALA